jgi:uncharacterized phiE125 gp8 family phage protein
MRDYTTVVTLKARMGIADSADDAILGACIAAASRHVEDYTGRVYYATTATKYYRAETEDVLFVDDLLSVSAMATDDGNRTYPHTWSATDYDLEPDNSTPYQRIRIAPTGTKSWPIGLAKGVRIIGSWGYSTKAPSAIEEAVLLLASRLFKRKDAPFGVAGTVEAGTIALPRIDPDVRMLLEPFRRVEMW